MAIESVHLIASIILFAAAVFQCTSVDGYVVCYFTNWAVYREGKASYTPKNINPRLCTHINYAFAIMDGTTYTVKGSNPDYDNEFFKEITALNGTGIKTLISIGGGSDSAGNNYSDMASTASSRTKFANSAVNFCIEHGFNGIDLDWEFPACPSNGDCSAGRVSDKQNFVALLAELKALLTKRRTGSLLTIAASANQNVIDAGYNLRKITQYCDFINIMAYDYYGSWSTGTGPTAPFDQAKKTIEYYLKKGVKPKKLVLGMATYGATFTLQSSSNNGLGAPVSGPGLGGQYTRSPGALAFFEIISKIKKDKWKVVHKKNYGSYAYSGTQWVGYDDIGDFAAKCNYIKSKGLAGAMVWTLDMDDFMDTACGRKDPLISIIAALLSGKSTSIKNCT